MKNPASKIKAPVTVRALTQRINRKLRQQPNPEKLVAAKGAQREELGDYYTVELRGHGTPQSAMSQGVALVNVNIEQLARKLGVMEPWEKLVLEKGE